MPVDNTIPPNPSESGGSDEVVDLANGLKIPVKFKRLKDRNPVEAWTLLVYGNSKTGKTYFAGTGGGPSTVFINIGDGLDTLKAPSFSSKYKLESEETIVVDIREKNPETKDEAFDIVCDTVNAIIQNMANSINLVIIDEATALRKYALNRAMDMVSMQRTKARLGHRSEEYVKADVQDFNVEMDMIEWFLGQYTPKFKQNGINFLMLAHERQIFKKPEKIGDEPTLARIMPAFTGKTFPDKVPAYFDDVMRTEVAADAASNTVYRIRTAGNDSYLSGTRHGGIFNVLETNPNYKEMLQRIKNSTPKPSTSNRLKK